VGTAMMLWIYDRILKPTQAVAESF
jgi:hypothetical protein